MIKSVEVLIIGAGLAGLMAAQKCQEKGIAYLVLDKARGIGGRMATRRISGGKADHGAQFFTARSNTMKELVSKWQEAGIVSIWANGFHQMNSLEEGEPISINHDGYPRYIGKDGMNSILKYVAESLCIETTKRVVKIEYEEQWIITVLHSDGEEEFRANRLFLSTPVPQALNLLDAGNISLEEAVRSDLEQLSYYPCLCALVSLKQQTNIPAPGGIQVLNGKISFISDNQKKGISKETVVTIHASEDWSREYFERDDNWIIEQLIQTAKPLLGDGEIVEKQLMKWRYSKPEILHPTEYLGNQVPGPLVFAGDIFKQGKVEGAILSGLSGIDWLLQE